MDSISSYKPATSSSAGSTTSSSANPLSRLSQEQESLAHHTNALFTPQHITIPAFPLTDHQNAMLLERVKKTPYQGNYSLLDLTLYLAWKEIQEIEKETQGAHPFDPEISTLLPVLKADCFFLQYLNEKILRQSIASDPPQNLIQGKAGKVLFTTFSWLEEQLYRAVLNIDACLPNIRVAPAVFKKLSETGKKETLLDKLRKASELKGRVVEIRELFQIVLEVCKHPNKNLWLAEISPTTLVPPSDLLPPTKEFLISFVRQFKEIAAERRAQQFFALSTGYQVPIEIYLNEMLSLLEREDLPQEQKFNSLKESFIQAGFFIIHLQEASKRLLQDLNDALQGTLSHADWCKRNGSPVLSRKNKEQFVGQLHTYLEQLVGVKATLMDIVYQLGALCFSSYREGVELPGSSWAFLYFGTELIHQGEALDFKPSTNPLLADLEKELMRITEDPRAKNLCTDLQERFQLVKKNFSEENQAAGYRAISLIYFLCEVQKKIDSGQELQRLLLKAFETFQNKVLQSLDEKNSLTTLRALESELENFSGGQGLFSAIIWLQMFKESEHLLLFKHQSKEEETFENPLLEWVRNEIQLRTKAPKSFEAASIQAIEEISLEEEVLVLDLLEKQETTPTPEDFSIPTTSATASSSVTVEKSPSISRKSRAEKAKAFQERKELLKPKKMIAFLRNKLKEKGVLSKETFGKGSHYNLRGDRTYTVPTSHDLRPGLAHSLIKTAKASIDKE